MFKPTYRQIDIRIWNDEKFSTLSDDAKLVFLFLLTHPHMTSLGAMRATLPGLAAELHWPAERLLKAFGEPFRKGMVKHDERHSFVWLPRFLKYNQPTNPNVVKSWPTAMQKLPECDMRDALFVELKSFIEGFAKPFSEAFTEAFGNGIAIQEQEQEQEQEQDKDSDELSDSNSKNDLLNKYPILSKFFPRLLEMLHAAHPRAAHIPKPNTKRFLDWQRNLASLAKNDGFDEGEIVDCLTWLFEDEEPKNGFSWRAQVQSIPGLRNRKSADDPIKFAKIFEAWQRERDNGMYRNRTRPFTEEEKKNIPGLLE